MQQEKIAQLRECKRCLLREMADGNEAFASMQEYIENLDSSVKADELAYEQRLAVCKECERLLSGMCRGCGCYVELRAAIKKNHCPYDRW